jgi:hypothetical protein
VKIRIIGFVLLGIALLMGATLVVYAFTTGTVGCLGPCGNNGGAPFITGNITITSGSQGLITLEFRTVGTLGTSSPSITNITLVNGDQANGTGLSNITGFQFKYNGSPVSAANPLPWDQTASESMVVAKISAGSTYQLDCYYTLSNGGPRQSFEEFSISVVD